MQPVTWVFMQISRVECAYIKLPREPLRGPPRWSHAAWGGGGALGIQCGARLISPKVLKPGGRAVRKGPVEARRQMTCRRHSAT